MAFDKRALGEKSVRRKTLRHNFNTEDDRNSELGTSWTHFN